MNGPLEHPDQDTVVTHVAVESAATDGDGLISPRTAMILAGGSVEVWLGCVHPVIGGAVASGVAVAFLLHRLLRRR